MPFQPQVNQELDVDDETYHVAEHPAAPEIPYGQEGRQAVVYQLVAGTDRRALKVFKPRYRLPDMVSLADRIAPLAGLQGLRVCQRIVLTPQRHATLLRQHPDLTYAVMMPWVEGPTWMEVLVEQRALSAEESLALARSLAEILAGMEQRRLAHCDLSGPNVMLQALVQHATAGWRPSVALVDVEQLYGPALERPELLPGGSPGYAHKTAPDGLWGATADRFAGAVLLGEILGWRDDRVREAAWGENYFDPQEMQRDSERYRTLALVLEERWGDGVGGLFGRAWRSDVLADCATFGEWLVTLPEEVPETVSFALPEVEPATDGEVVSDGIEAAVHALMEVARRLEGQGNLIGALEVYRQARALAPAGGGLADELGFVVRDLETGLKDVVVPPPGLASEEEAEAEPADSPMPFLDERPKDPDLCGGSSAGMAELDALFEDGLTAYDRQEWARARELLAEVVRRQPDYERNGQKASSLLAEVESRLSPRGRLVLLRPWILGGLATLTLGLGILMALRLLWPVKTASILVQDEVFVSDRDGQREIYRMVEGSAVQMTHTPGNAESWSPALGQGGELLFTSDRSGKREVYHLLQGKVEQVTHTPGNAESWSPTLGRGGELLFTSDRSGKREVYYLLRGKVEQVTLTPGDAESWSPALGQGGELFFTSDRSGKREVYYLLRGKVEQVTLTPGSAESWAPALGQGGALLFTSDRSGKCEVYRLLRGKVEQVTDTTGNGESWLGALE